MGPLRRRAQLEDTARKCFEKLDGETQLWCRRYVDGINDALAAGHRSGREFELTETAPSPWNPWTPLGVFLVRHILFSTFPNKLFRAHVARSLGTTAVELFSIEAPVWSGSNAWTVHGSCTATGSPLIAGDPHRLLELPGTYQQVRLSCPEFDVVGFAFPGVPGLPHFGHTGNAAWAITNAMGDYQDLYEEDLRRSGSDVLARGEHAWEAADVRWETIRIREGGTEEIEVIETRRGLIIEGGPAPLESPLVEEESDGGAVPWKPPLALRFPARVERRLGFEALLPLMRSRNVDDVEQALGRWVEPVNSVVAADRQGAVRHFLAGLVPRRHPDNRKLPVPAWSPKHQWSDGFIPLPRTDVSRFAVSANDRAAGGGEDVALEFAPAHRARRISQLLGDSAPLVSRHRSEGAGLAEPAPAAKLLTVKDMQAIHSDTLLGSLPVFQRVLAQLQPEFLSEEARQLRSRILAWDGRMDADSVEAGVFARWRSTLVQHIAGHAELMPLAEPHHHSPLFGPWLSVASRVGFALETLLSRGHELGIDVGFEAAAALEAAASESDNAAEGSLDLGPPVSQPWGKRHTLLPVHELPGGLAAAIPVTPLSGDTGCVLSTESLPGVEDRSFRGPVARYVWDLSDRQDSRWIVPFGAAGTPSSPHFADQLPL